MQIVLLFILGLLVGSFLNVVIERLKTREAIARGRSRCDHCKHVLQWFELIPVVSFLALGGKCRKCKKRIHIQHIVLEIATGVLFSLVWLMVAQAAPATAWWNAHESLFYVIRLISYLAYVSILIIIFVYDLKYYLILDKISIPAIIFALIVELMLTPSIGQLTNIGLGVLIGGGFFLAQFVLSRGKWIGGGDIRLGAFMGVILGWPHILVALFIAYIIGAVAGVGLLIAGKKEMGSHVPFGTFLAVATCIALVYAQPLLQWYLGII